VPLAILFPRFDHDAVEERYASWQSELLLERATDGAEIVLYDRNETMREIVAGLTQELCLVVTDPLLLATRPAIDLLKRALSDTGAAAAVPVSNEAPREEVRAALPEGYLTIRQFEEMSARMAARKDAPVVVDWTDGNPGLMLTRTSALATSTKHADEALRGLRVAVAPSAYVHRWAPLRAQERLDLLERVPVDVKSILEFGCAEGLLGGAIRKRQKCRVVGIEHDRDAAAQARKRLDDVYCGDVRELISIIDQRFDFVIGGDILEHLDDPWSFLIDLRRVMLPGGHLLLSIPNAANWAIVSDLLRGRFDYSYIGIACAGHLRFFTKQTITDALTIAGWDVVTIEPQAPIVTREYEAMIANLRAAGITHSAEELAAPGYYVLARIR
jgi:2-polyprenyl-3-methyl-5-hydroxy-6-metoxy-1,4-benzoquinol methylase